AAVDQKILIEIVELLEPQIVQNVGDLIPHGHEWMREHGIETALLEQASARGFARPQAGPTLRAVKEADEGPRGAADAGGCVERKVDIAHQSGLFGWQAAIGNAKRVVRPYSEAAQLLTSLVDREIAEQCLRNRFGLRIDEGTAVIGQKAQAGIADRRALIADPVAEGRWWQMRAGDVVIFARLHIVALVRTHADDMRKHAGID